MSYSTPTALDAACTCMGHSLHSKPISTHISMCQSDYVRETVTGKLLPGERAVGEEGKRKMGRDKDGGISISLMLGSGSS